MNDLAKATSGFAFFPGMLGMQMRNIQACTSAQAKMLDGMRLLGKQHAQFMEAVMRRMLEGRSASAPSDPGSLIGSGIDQLKAAIMDTQANMSEGSEILARSAGDAAGIMQKRFLDALDEIKAIAEHPADAGRLQS
ncbi:MAG TPA: phasin family protein [Acetobacteraceae bacterium]|jgi:hypothetical protein|nr:phasin family protein [Acetobacteraceae bacterium]